MIKEKKRMLAAPFAIFMLWGGAACVLDIDIRPADRSLPDPDFEQESYKCEEYTPGLTPLALGHLDLSAFESFHYEFQAATEENCPILFDKLVQVTIENKQQVYSFEFNRGVAGPDSDCDVTPVSRGILDSARVGLMMEAFAAVRISPRSRKCPPGVAIDPSTTRDFEWDGALVIDQPCVCPRLDEEESNRLARMLESIFEDVESPE